MHLSEGTELQNGKYRLNRVLGQGGFGITYLAEHILLNKLIAIKEFFPKEYCNRKDLTDHVSIGSKHSEELVNSLKLKFIKEAQNISKLHHQNIITIHDIFEENSTAYYVMEYIEGRSLLEIINEVGILPEEKALYYFKAVAEAVAYMHSKHMNHLDLKPANIMIRADKDIPILIDFGQSKQYDSSGQQTTATPVGISHGYAASEQYRPGGVSQFSPQTDIYSLGATLYAMLVGCAPPHYIDIIEDGFPVLSSHISSLTQNAIIKSMQIKKTERFQSMEEFSSILFMKDTSASGGHQSVNDKNTIIDSLEPIDSLETNTEENTVLQNKIKANDDTDEAAFLLEKGHASYNGIGVPKDFGKAFLSYQEAAYLGNLEAMHCIAVMYIEGIGIVPDLEKGFYWCRKAAEAGLIEAMERLGEMYESGIGVPLDKQEAFRWFCMATKERNKLRENESEGPIKKIDAIPSDADFEDEEYDEIEEDFDNYEKNIYVDLGLSVNWASKNIGAYFESDCGYEISKEEFHYLNFMDQFDINDATLPSKDQIIELIEKCEWIWVDDKQLGYKIIGPNGRYIFLPISGHRDSTSQRIMIEFYGQYWSDNLLSDDTSLEFLRIDQDGCKELVLHSSDLKGMIRKVMQK